MIGEPDQATDFKQQQAALLLAGNCTCRWKTSTTEPQAIYTAAADAAILRVSRFAWNTCKQAYA